MKVQNPTKLDIFFKGGGIIKFPVQNLKQIDVEPIDEQGGGSSAEVDYEAIYQFYKNKIIESIPEESLEDAIIPEHYADLEFGMGNSQEYRGKSGIWLSYSAQPDFTDLFCEIETSPYLATIYHIYFGDYIFNDK